MILIIILTIAPPFSWLCCPVVSLSIVISVCNDSYKFCKVCLGRNQLTIVYFYGSIFKWMVKLLYKFIFFAYVCSFMFLQILSVVVRLSKLMSSYYFKTINCMCNCTLTMRIPELLDLLYLAPSSV